MLWLAWPMDNSTIAIIVTAVTALGALLWTIMGWQRMRGTRQVLRGLGLFLIPIGLWLTGVMELAVEGAKALYRFFADKALDNMTIAGIVVAAVGLMLAIFASAVKPVSREESKQRRLAREQRPDSQGASRPGADRPTQPARLAAQQQRRPQQAAGLDAEDAEIEALLRKRGIE